MPLVEVHRRENGKWTYNVFEENDEVTLASLDLHFSCAALYADIEFAGAEVLEEEDDQP